MQFPEEIGQIRETVAAWARNRELYPGWVIAPRETRALVWQYTSGWIKTFLDRLKEVEYQEQLEWCFELNWRLEVALVPLLSPLADQIWELVRAADPFADKTPPPIGEPPAAARGEFKDVAKARVRWLSLGFAVLRFFREAGRLEDFETFRIRLAELVPSLPDLICRLAYEQCLWALGRLDHTRATALAKTTPVGDSSDPFWLVRFAAVLAELDELEAAEKLADEGLARIRSRIDPSMSDLAMPSREGWAMLLARGIKQARLWGLGKLDDVVGTELALFDGRWKQLERLKCNPSTEIDDLRLRLRHLPAPRLEETRLVGFDRVEVRRTIRFGSAILPERTLIALEANRLIEEVGFPPACGSIDMSRDLLKAVIRNLGGHELSLILPLILRAEDTRDNDRFSRHEVAALSVEEDHRLFAFLYSAVNSLFLIYEQHHRRESRWLWELHSFATAIDLLSRVTVRGSDVQIDQSLSLVLRMLHLPILRADMRVNSHAGELLARSVEAASPNLIVARAIDLMNLPLWSETNQREVSRIPSPGQLIDQRQIDLSGLVGNEQWHETLKSLLHRAERGRGFERSDALLRLLLIYRNNGLTNEESNAFGRAFWRVDEANRWQLPAQFGPNAVLMVPEMQPGEAQRTFRRWCLELALPRFREPLRADGTASPILVNADRDSLLLALVVASQEPDPVHNPIAIEWNGQEAEQIFEKYWSWWEAEGAETVQLLDSGFVKDQVFTRFYSGLKMIGYIAAPYAAEIHNFAGRTSSLLKELEAAKFPTVGALPLLAGAVGLTSDQVESRLRHALVSTDEHAIDAALDGIFEWVKWEKARRLGEISQDLLNELANTIAIRRRPGLRVALRVAKFIARRRPELLSERTIALLRVGLDYLSAETRYRPYPDDSAASTISYLEVPLFRHEAAGLAIALRNIAGLWNDPVIGRWVEQVSNDPLPELRRLADEEGVSP